MKISWMLLFIAMAVGCSSMQVAREDINPGAMFCNRCKKMDRPFAVGRTVVMVEAYNSANRFTVSVYLCDKCEEELSRQTSKFMEGFIQSQVLTEPSDKKSVK